MTAIAITAMMSEYSTRPYPFPFPFACDALTGGVGTSLMNVRPTAGGGGLALRDRDPRATGRL